MIISIPRNNSNKFNWLLLLCLFISVIANAQSPEKEKATSLLKKHGIGSLKQSIPDSYRVTDAYQDVTTGLFLVYAQQLYQGVPVFNKISVYAFKNDSMLYNKQDIFQMRDQASSRTASYSIQPEQAIQYAAKHLSITASQQPQVLRKEDQKKHFVYKMGGRTADSSSADLIWLPINNGKELKLAWNVHISPYDMHDNWMVRIDAQTGAFIEKNNLVVHERASDECGAILPVANPSRLALNNLTKFPSLSGTNTNLLAPAAVSSAQYNVFALPLPSANYGNRSIEINPWLKAGANSDATTLGWHFDNTTNYNTTRGNNTYALDAVSGFISANSTPDVSSTAIPSLTFNQALNTAANPALSPNLQAGMDNLFYWCNIMHDVSYQYGFNEVAGNYQASNLGRGGKENDFVYALAGNGFSLNNADFATSPDGGQSGIRMFLWKSDLWGASLHINNAVPVANDYAVFEAFTNLQSQLGFTGPKTGKVIRVNDDGATTNFGCGIISNATDIKNNIALIDMGGGCSFEDKISNAQNAGAVAIILINDLQGTPPQNYLYDNDLTHFRADIKIPCVYVTSTDGATFISNLSGLNVTLSTTSLFRDGALDNVVVVHEFTHGISSRLTGGPSNNNCLGNIENGTEGWSDYVALMLTTNWTTAQLSDGSKPIPIATYTQFQPADGPGIRTYPYSTDLSIDPWSYGDMATATGGEIHTIGEIWCTVLWDMTWAIIQTEGIDPDIYNGKKGNNIALQLVMEGMKLQPCSPGFLDSRDAILKADSILYGYRHKCIIWNAFARRGMGNGASQGSPNSYTDQRVGFDLPWYYSSITADKSVLTNGDIVNYTIKAQCGCMPLSGVSVVDTLSNLTYISSSGGSYTAPAVRFSGLNFDANEIKTLTIQAKVSGSHPGPVTQLNDTRDPASYNWTPTIISGSTNWVESTRFSHSPTHSWFAGGDPQPTGLKTLSSGDILLLNDPSLTLSFWHSFFTDNTNGGGIVEISADGGQNWSDLGPYMIQNSYSISKGDFHTGAPSFYGNGLFNLTTGALTFVQTIISLKDFKGRSVRFRFSFVSGNTAPTLGWFVDDINISSKPGLLNTAYSYWQGTRVLLDMQSVFGFFPSAVLPLHFISFDAQKQNKSAALHWKVSNEINISKYVVERSADGINFSPIGEVSYSNTSANEKDYYFTDNQPLTGNNYYRIAEKDLDGKSTLSVVKLLSFNTDNNSVRLSPVPTHNHTVQLEIESTNAGPYNAYLLNAVGQAIKNYSVKTGINQLDLQNFANGIYYLKVDLGNGRTELRKLVIE